MVPKWLTSYLPNYVINHLSTAFSPISNPSVFEVLYLVKYSGSFKYFISHDIKNRFKNAVRLHHIQRWDNTHFVQTSLGKLGLVIFLGHDMRRCPNAPINSNSRPFVTVHTNGIHIIDINFCFCNDATDDLYQLTSAGLFPATTDKPETVFTFTMLKDFHAHTLASKKSAYDHFFALRKLTNNAFPDRTPVSTRFVLVYPLHGNHVVIRSLS